MGAYGTYLKLKGAYDERLDCMDTIDKVRSTTYEESELASVDGEVVKIFETAITTFSNANTALSDIVDQASNLKYANTVSALSTMSTNLKNVNDTSLVATVQDVKDASKRAYMQVEGDFETEYNSAVNGNISTLATELPLLKSACNNLDSVNDETLPSVKSSYQRSYNSHKATVVSQLNQLGSHIEVMEQILQDRGYMKAGASLGEFVLPVAIDMLAVDTDIDYLNMTDEEIRQYLLDKYGYEVPTFDSIDDVFAFSFENGGSYGTNQNPYLQGEYRDYIVDVLKNNYGFSDEDAETYLTKLSSAATCTYARCCNSVYSAYYKNPALFEETFGFPMYYQTNDGKIILNDAQLLVDINITDLASDDGNFVGKDASGNYQINPDGFFFNNADYKCFPGFIADKTSASGVQLNLNATEILNDSQNPSTSQISAAIEDALKSGDNVFIGMCPRAAGHGNTDPNAAESIPFIDSNGNSWGMSGGHWVTITGTTDTGIFVDSWGEKMYVDYNEIVDNAYFNLYTESVSLGGGK